MSTRTDGQGWCIDLIKLSPIGQLILTVSNNSLGVIVGPVLPVNVWAHIAYTYSAVNILQLYINGTFKTSTSPTTNSVSNEVNILTLGNALQASTVNSCIAQSVVPNVYNGLIDEFRVYSRELNINDIHILASS